RSSSSAARPFSASAALRLWTKATDRSPRRTRRAFISQPQIEQAGAGRFGDDMRPVRVHRHAVAVAAPPPPLATPEHWQAGTGTAVGQSGRQRVVQPGFARAEFQCAAAQVAGRAGPGAMPVVVAMQEGRYGEQLHLLGDEGGITLCPPAVGADQYAQTPGG